MRKTRIHPVFLWPIQNLKTSCQDRLGKHIRNQTWKTKPGVIFLPVCVCVSSQEGGGITYNATTELSKPLPPGIFRVSFRIPARGLDFSMEGIELRRSGNYLYELVGNTNDTFELRQKPKSSELLPQLRRCFYFLLEGNAATYDSSKFCDACESMPMFAEWTDNRVRQQCCAGACRALQTTPWPCCADSNKPIICC
jgi:hypothetical protein